MAEAVVVSVAAAEAATMANLCVAAITDGKYHLCLPNLYSNLTFVFGIDTEAIRVRALGMLSLECLICVYRLFVNVRW